MVARTGSAWTHPLADRLSHPGPPAGGHANKYVARYPPRFRSVPLVGSPAHCGFRDASPRFQGAQALCDRPHARRSPLPQQMRLVLQGSYDCCTFVWRSALFVQSRRVLHSHSTPSTRSSTSAGFLPRDSRISPRGWHLCAQEWLPYLCRQQQQPMFIGTQIMYPLLPVSTGSSMCVCVCVCVCATTTTDVYWYTIHVSSYPQAVI